VTLCIERRLPLLGTVEDADVRFSAAGEMVAGVWGGLGSYYPGVEIDAYIVMPNHLHGIVVLETSLRADRDGATVPTPASQRVPGSVPDGKPALSLSTVMQRFKTFTMHKYGVGVRSQGWPPYPGRLWQHRFHEHVIRNQRDLTVIREYIANNPHQWLLDLENPDRRATKRV